MAPFSNRARHLRLIAGPSTITTPTPATAMTTDVDHAQRLADEVRRDLRGRREAIVQKRESAESNETLLRARVHGSPAPTAPQSSARTSRPWDQVARLLRRHSLTHR